MIVSAPAKRRRRGGPPVVLCEPAARLVTHAQAHEVVRPVTGDITDLRPRNWLVRNSVTGQVRRGDLFSYGPVPRAA